MSGKVLRVAVVGGSTLLGKELLEEIGNSAAAVWDLQILEEGDEAEGQLTSAGEEALVMHTLEEAAFAGLDLVFFAGSAEVTRQYLKAALDAGVAVIDMSGATSEEPGFLLRSPWIDGAQRPDLTTAGIRVPHTAALVLSLILDRLQRNFGEVELTATVLEPASQAGSAGVDELHQQTVNLLSFQEVPKAVFGAQVAFNVQGILGEESTVSLTEIRAQIEQDARRVVGPQGHGFLTVNVLQAPVFHGYVISAHVRTTSGATNEAIRSALEGSIVIAAAGTEPSNQAAIDTGDVLARVEADAERSGSTWLTLAADNLRLGARSAVQLALELAALRPGSRVQ